MCGGHFWIAENFRFFKMSRISCLADEFLVSQENICLLDVVGWFVFGWLVG
jgi:hypothetical protein